MSEFFDILISFFTLTILEIVLSIDNIVFIAILSLKLPPSKRKQAVRIGLSLAWISRLILLLFAVWLTKLTTPWFEIFDFPVSGRNLFLMFGGLFLLAKATQEIHVEMDPAFEDEKKPVNHAFHLIILQIVLLDMIFSFDSIFTAIGLTARFWLMAISITIAIIAMMIASEPLSKFIKKYPSIKMLSLSFLLLIGMILVADALTFHIPRGYIYFALSFSILVESLNIMRKGKQQKTSNNP